jgi:hypothetical protein
MTHSFSPSHLRQKFGEVLATARKRCWVHLGGYIEGSSLSLGLSWSLYYCASSGRGTRLGVDTLYDIFSLDGDILVISWMVFF